PGDEIVGTLEQLAEAVGVGRDVKPIVSERAPAKLPTGTLNQTSIAQDIVALSPEGAILIDESVSSGRDFFPMSYGAAPHDFLQITGGAIGSGIPMATGAAIGAPGRKVIGLQADGSAMYTVQGLWTQARERLDVVTVIFANRRYNILLGELKQVGATVEPGHNARRMLDLVDPVFDWVAIAKGMGVEAVRVESAETFSDALSGAMGRRGPFLIEAVI
ncbi:MAG: thiamine pyrophosphate-dependent enzyme, partial [Burkholderiales bacterium]